MKMGDQPKSETKRQNPSILEALVGGAMDAVLPGKGEYGKTWGNTYETTITGNNGETYRGYGRTPQEAQENASKKYGR